MKIIRNLVFFTAFVPTLSFAQLYGDYSVRIEVEGNGYAHYTTVYFEDEAWATYGYDNCCEALFNLGQADQPHVYTQVIGAPVPPDNRISINAFPHVFEATSVPLGFLSGTLAQYSFTFKQLWTIPSGITVQLEDLSLNVYQDLLADSTYETWGAASDSPDRFIIHFNPEVTGQFGGHSTLEMRNVSWTQEEKKLKFHLSGTEKRLVSVFDITGKQIERFTLTLSLNEQSVNVPQSGVYIIRVIDSEGQNWSERVFVNNF